MPLEPGLSATVIVEVGDDDTAIALGSGTVPVLGTPRLLALCEQAACDAIAGQLPEGSVSVGVQVMLDHVAPSPVGQTITAEATLDKIVGRKLIFTTSARDGRGLIAAGKVVRVIVDERKFLAKCE
jgi:predicted thioesterase